MENAGDGHQKNLIITELTQGKELAGQLQALLNAPAPASHEAREVLIGKILTSYEKVLAMLKWGGGAGPSGSGDPLAVGFPVGVVTESPRSQSESPRSEDSDRDLEQKDGSRKRKGLPRWTKQVQISPGVGVEGPLEDGYGWRKYGQKDILGARYPRGYYRCTHRLVQGCLATKQVQRSDDNPTIFEITYRGRHTCTQASAHGAPPPPAETQEPIETHGHLHLHHHHQPNIPPQQNFELLPQDRLLNLQNNLRVITQNLDNPHDPHQHTPSMFSFPSPSSMTGESSFYSAAMLESSLVGNFSPSFVTPAATGSNYFGAASASNLGGTQRAQALEGHDLAEMVTAAATTGGNSSPMVGVDQYPPFGIGQMDQFDPNFTFDNPGFFPN
ncbi:probable WRKY transcription factor 53 isoform X2 [Malania oleifera]|uniref:probable WRKY transcription factor 53 isoform X2 n=1 Tax=Malania oleifera TaxID=397392 RepID=UPI0025ADE3BA|nr:probable WRKY transcription factor 53 isoform X2 [Malania oleifera]